MCILGKNPKNQIPLPPPHPVRSLLRLQEKNTTLSNCNAAMNCIARTAEMYKRHMLLLEMKTTGFGACSNRLPFVTGSTFERRRFK